MQALETQNYWLNMQKHLDEAYVPSCPDCQCNKSRTNKPFRLLHPLPIPEQHGDSVTIDFIGPLPPDDGYNSIITFTDHLTRIPKLHP